MKRALPTLALSLLPGFVMAQTDLHFVVPPGTPPDQASDLHALFDRMRDESSLGGEFWRLDQTDIFDFVDAVERLSHGEGGIIAIPNSGRRAAEIFAARTGLSAVPGGAGRDGAVFLGYGWQPLVSAPGNRTILLPDGAPVAMGPAEITLWSVTPPDANQTDIASTLQDWVLTQPHERTGLADVVTLPAGDAPPTRVLVGPGGTDRDDCPCGDGRFGAMSTCPPSGLALGDQLLHDAPDGSIVLFGTPEARDDGCGGGVGCRALRTSFPDFLESEAAARLSGADPRGFSDFVSQAEAFEAQGDIITVMTCPPSRSGGQ